MIVCPLCQSSLENNGKAWSCEKGHSFDCAAEGYLSLILNSKDTANLGDSPEMVACRMRVHAAGIYEPLAEELRVVAKSSKTILDIGCGEGYFLAALSQESKDSYGIDISRPALRKAAVKYKKSHFIRCDCRKRLPFADGSIDWVQSIFAPRPIVEIQRVLSKKGRVVFVYPQPDHLEELRKYVNLAKIGEDKPDENSFPDLKLKDSRELKYKKALSAPQLADLVGMSPSIYRLDTEGQWKKEIPASLGVTISLKMVVFGSCE